ncbi:MAG: aminotransferase class III-fold pyridoxal phosphate-dependent enzyme [Pirellulales bacterium]
MPSSPIASSQHAVPRSIERFNRALQLIPGGTQLISRRPSRYAAGVSPAFAARAVGARFWDIDGHEYIDWVSGIGAIILGYADPVVNEAVCQQIALGNCFSINHELEIELAEELVRLIPCAEMVRYAKCGGEACAVAVRIARGATGRDKILFCGYHGWQDWYLAANLGVEANLDAHLFPGIEPIGVPAALANTAIPFAYGDLASLCQRLDENAGQVAAVIMEPLRSAMPPAGYLASVAQVCQDRGVVLIFDEVTTGFRLSPGGVEPVLGVTPDMAVFAKSISNGFPMAAVAGRRKVMEHAAHMFISSTYWSDTIGLRAALTTLREIERRGVPEYLDQLGATIKQRMNEAAADAGLDVSCEGMNIHPHLRFNVGGDAALQGKLATLYIQEMAKRGCHGYASFYLNAAQGEPEIAQTAAAALEAFGIIAGGLAAGNIDSLLECDVQKDYFRRIVS